MADNTITLDHITRVLGISPINDHNEMPLTGVTADSRKVQRGFIFVCIEGGSFDGHDYIDQALEAGAALIVQSRPTNRTGSGTVITVPDTREALGLLADLFAGHPSRNLDLIGVTGTNGKTTTTFFIQSILVSAGVSTGLIGTIGYSMGEKLIPLQHTTPEPVVVQDLLRTFVDHDLSAAAMEVSSHALVQKRVTGCSFKAGVFTNITDREHLDFHGTFENYRLAKTSFFQDYIAPFDHTFAVINGDDPNCHYFASEAGTAKLIYSRKGAHKAEIVATDVKPDLFGVSFMLSCGNGPRGVRINIPGLYNVENALAAAGVGIGLGLNMDQIVTGLNSLKTVPGRFDAVYEGQEFAVIVDYAHTDDALKNLLIGARACNPQRVITVFGCGGDRDRTKRPRMGAISCKYSDLVFVTSDNPRSEDPLDIIEDIKKGISDESKTRIVPERRQAIREAISEARAGDIVVIAGKGHEDYQILPDRTIHFDDREEARNALKNP